MQQYHRHRRRRLSGAAIALVLVCAVLAYAGVLLGVKLIGSRLEGSEAAEPVGSLDGRFSSDKLTLQYANRTWTYRRQDLTNLLLIGVDWAEMDLPAASGRYAGQADFLLLVTIDRENKTISTLQIDRDTMADIRVYGPFGDYTGIRKTQICLSHAYGETAEENCENTLWAVSRLMGNVPIDGYLALDMDAITLLNDALGGVTVTLEEDLSVLDPQMVPGARLTLEGSQAEAFVRGRTGVGDGTNAARMKRQRAFLQGAGDQVAQGLAEDPGFAGMLLDALEGHLVMNVTRGWLINKAYESSQYERTEMRSLAGSHVLGEDGFVEFHVDADALNDLLTTGFFE